MEVFWEELMSPRRRKQSVRGRTTGSAASAERRPPDPSVLDKPSGRRVDRRLFLLANVAAILMAVIMIGLSRAAVPADSFEQASNGATPSPAATPLPLAMDTSLGSPDAPVIIEMFSDFQCTVCQIFSMGTEQEIRRAYVDTGQARLVFRHFVVHGEESMQAALASGAAAEQGKFWEYHDLLMESEASPSKDDLTIVKLQSVARQVGLDMDMFSASFTSQKFREAVEKDIAEAKARGLRGTPTFLVHGTRDGKDITLRGEGNISFAAFKKLMDEFIAPGSGQ
jgi:protein-disulfide isomerase